VGFLVWLDYGWILWNLPIWHNRAAALLSRPLEMRGKSRARVSGLHVVGSLGEYVLCDLALSLPPRQSLAKGCWCAVLRRWSTAG